MRFTIDFFNGDSRPNIPEESIKENQDLLQKFNSQASIGSADEF